MKKLVVVLSVVFLGAISYSASANKVVKIDNNQVEVSVSTPDEKPCPADCTCDKCKGKDAKATDSKAADCSKKTDCKKSEKKAGCCAGAKASTTTTETKESTDKK